LATEQHKLTENVAEGVAVVTPEVRDGLEIRLEVPQQPDYLDIAVGFGLQPTARPYPVQVAVYVELQQVCRRIARAACRLRLNAAKRCRRKIKPIYKGINEAYGLSGPT